MYVCRIMQSDEFAIDHLNGLRLSYNSKDGTDNKNNLKQKHSSNNTMMLKSEKSSDNNDAESPNGILQQRYRRHKKSKKNKKKMNGESHTEGGSDYAEESKQHYDEDEEVPNRRLMIITTPLTERRRGSSRRKSNPPGVKTKIPKLPIIAAGIKGGSPKDDKLKLNADYEDEEDGKGEDTESYLYAESKGSDVIYAEKQDDQREDNKKEKFNVELKNELMIGHDSKSTRLDFVWKMHLRFRSLGIMTNGLVAGLALSQCIFIFSFSNKNLKDDYSDLAMLFQSIYYVLLTISTVSVLDSFFSLDSDWAGFLRHLIAKPLRAVTLVSYVLSLIFSISLAQLDDSISMHRVSLYKLDTWKALNMFRVITSIIGWVSVSFSPLDDVTGTCIMNKKTMEHEKTNDDSIGGGRMTATPLPEITANQQEM